VFLAYGTAFRGGRHFFDRPEADVRREEATAACDVLGATPKFFPYSHDKLAADPESVKAVSTWLDDVKPDVVVTHWPLDMHPNHHAVSSLVWQCYQRSGGWSLYFFEVMTDQQTIAFRPELYLDITPVRDLKKRGLDQHRSQGPESIWTAHERMHRRRGAECGVASAEAYSLVEAKPGCPLLPVKFLSRKVSDRAVTISDAKRDRNGVLVHTVASPYESATTGRSGGLWRAPHSAADSRLDHWRGPIAYQAAESNHARRGSYPRPSTGYLMPKVSSGRMAAVKTTNVNGSVPTGRDRGGGLSVVPTLKWSQPGRAS
jgi:LmbE family N-acetylglucosaminyl deacetylase